MLFFAVKRVWIVLLVTLASHVRADDRFTLDSGDIVAVVSGMCSDCQSLLQLQTVRFVSQHVGWSIATSPDEVEMGRVRTTLQTSDGGRTWSPLPFDHDAIDHQALNIAVLSPSNAWAGYFDLESAESGLYATSDLGQHWRLVSRAAVDIVRAFDLRNVAALEKGPSATTFAYSRDGARSWKYARIPLSAVSAAEFYDLKHGFVLGVIEKKSHYEFAAIFTSDGGEKWTQAILPPGFKDASSDVVSIHGANAFAIAWLSSKEQSILLKSSDRAASWHVVKSPVFDRAGRRFIAVVFGQKSDRGYVFYSDPATSTTGVATTDDDGQSWSDQAFPVPVSQCAPNSFGSGIVCSSGMDTVFVDKPARLSSENAH